MSLPIYDALQLSIDDMKFEFFFSTKISIQGRYTSDLHFHDFYELFYCVKGTVEICHESGTIQLSTGDVGIVPAHTNHGIHTDGETIYVLLSFWNGEQIWEQGYIHHLCHIPVSNVFGRMMDYYYGNYRYKKELLRACLSEAWLLLMEYHRTLPPQNGSVVTLENSLYRRYVIENYLIQLERESLNLPELATLLHLSIHQTQRIIRKLYGCSFRERLIFLRMEKAKNLLKNTEQPVAEIGLSVGYKTVHGFSNIFKKATGLTPAAYRKMCNKKE